MSVLQVRESRRCTDLRQFGYRTQLTPCDYNSQRQMNTIAKHQNAGADLGGAPCALPGHPTVASNTDTGIPQQLVFAFEDSNLSGAEALRTKPRRSKPDDPSPTVLCPTLPATVSP